VIFRVDPLPDDLGVRDVLVAYLVLMSYLHSPTDGLTSEEKTERERAQPLSCAVDRAGHFRTARILHGRRAHHHRPRARVPR
jgi:hypothetical protein